MIRTLLELLSNFIKIHYPVYGFGLLRLLLVLFGSVLLLAFFEWRFKTLTRFRNEKSTALNLAVARVAVAATLLCQVHLQEILLNASIDPALSIPFRVWGRLFAHLQVPPAGITAIYWIFLVSALLMLIGLFGRVAAAVAAVSATYLFSLLFINGKVDHNYHHLIFFSILCALFPSSDTLSLDAVFAAWRDADAGALRRSKPSLAYGYAMRCMWIFIGFAYYFPGLWKFSRAWIYWLSGNSLRDYIALSGDWVPWTPLQLWIFQHRLLASLGDILVVCFELGFIFLILFPRLRPFAGLLGLVFHNATYLMLRIQFIALQSCYFIFFDWTAIFSWIGRKFTIGHATVFYDPHCKLCRRTAGTLAIFDWTDSLRFVPNPGALYFSVTAKNAPAKLGYEGYKLIAERVPLLWLARPFMGLPGIQQFGTAIYSRIAGSRACSILDKTEAAGENVAPAKTPAIAYAVPLAALGIMMIFGVLHVIDMWPLSCFPTFDGRPSDTTVQLCIRTVDAANVTQDWNVTSDPRLRVVYRHWRWLAEQGMGSSASARPKAAAVVNLWLKYHPELDVRNVILFLDTYQMRPLEGRRIRVAREKSWELAF